MGCRGPKFVYITFVRSRGVVTSSSAASAGTHRAAAVACMIPVNPKS